MAKYTIEIEDELIKYFRENIDATEKTEIMLVKLLKLLREILETANSRYQ